MSSSRNFTDLQEARWNDGAFVCVGLDTDYRQIPQFFKDRHVGENQVEQTMFAFNRAIIDATCDVAGTYKFQSAYYEAAGNQGLTAMVRSVQYLHEKAPRVPLIADAKRADIGSSNEGYVQTIFDLWGFDAVTAHPYLGEEALRPFLDRTEKGVIVLCKTSNPGSGEFQNQTVMVDGDETPLYLYVASQVANKWNNAGNCSLVVGATYPEEAARIRQVAGDMTFLIPGIGAQGGDLAATVAASKNSKGTGMIINSSRGIIFASKEENFAERAREETIKLNDLIKLHASK